MSPLIRQLLRLFAKSILLSGAFILAPWLGTAPAATLSWSGGGASAYWNDSGNWGFAGTPANGDTLIFPGGVSRLTNTNNLSSLTVGEIRFVGASGGYAIYGNAFTLTNSILATNTAGANTINNNITLSTVNIAVTVNSGVSLTLAGALGGSVGLTKTGAGTLTYAGPSGNSYTGPTAVIGGLLNMGKIVTDGSIAAGSLAITNATVRETAAFQLGSIPITLVNGTFDLNGFSDTVGTSLTLSSGTVLLGGGQMGFLGGATGVTNLTGSSSIQNGTFNLPGTICTIEAKGTMTISANITGASGITETGNDFLYFSGANTYSGLTVVSSGYLWAQNNSALGGSVSGTVVSNGASLVVSGGIGITNETLTLNGFGAPGYSALDAENNATNTWAGPVQLATTSNIGAYSSTTGLRITGAITGAGGLTEIFAGSVFLQGSTANTYGGTTTVNSGTLFLGNSTGPSIPGALVVSDNAVVRLMNAWQIYGPGKAVTLGAGALLDLANNDEWVGPLGLRGSQITTGTGMLYLGDDVTVTSDPAAMSEISGKISLWNGTKSFVNIGHYFSPDLRINAIVDGNGSSGIIKDGPGEVHLAAPNTFPGSVTVNQGNLWVGNSGALGNLITTATVNSNGTLFLYGNIAIGTKPLVLNGPGWVSSFSPTNAGALSADFGNSSWAGPITLASDSQIQTHGASFNLALSGIISGPGALTKYGPGTVTFEGSGANTYSGGTAVKFGTLQLNKGIGNGAIPGNLVIGESVGGPNAAIVRLLNCCQTATSSDIQIAGSGLLDCNSTYISFDELSGNGNITFGTWGYIDVGNNNGSSTFSGVASGVGYSGGYTIRKVGAGTITLTGNNTYLNQTRVDGGTLLVNGSQPQSPFLIVNGGTGGGSGTVGDIVCSGTLAPGNSPGILTCSNVSFSSLAQYNVDLAGANPGTGYDQLSIRGTNNLGNETLQLSSSFVSPVAVSNQLVIMDNDGADANVGTFNGLANNAIIASGGYSFRLNYNAGSGNDVALTVLEVPGASVGSTVSAGNGDGIIGPNECNDISISITNKTGIPMTGVSAELVSATAGVAVTQPLSPYPDVPANNKGTNLAPFQISTISNFVCGTTINLRLTITTASHGSFTVPVAIATGVPASVPSRYDLSAITNIPDVGTIESTNIVAGYVGPLTKVGVSLWLTHTFDGDLNISLISPNGVVVDLSSGNGGSGANYGSACSPDSSRTTFDDAAGTSITAGSAPFTGTFKPEGSLATLVGGTANGQWRLRVQDTGGGTLGALRCWSLFLYGADCASGSGQCELCPNVVITSSMGAASPIQSGYATPAGGDSVCGVPKVCPGTSGGSYPSDNYTFRNGPSNACITVTLEQTHSAGGMAVAAYSAGFNPANPDKCVNYLAGPGAVVYEGIPQTFSFNVNSNDTFTVNIVSGGYGDYKLTVTGGDCRPALNINQSGTGAVLDWTTAAGGYVLEHTNALPSIAVTNWPVVTNMPIVVGGRYQVTNSIPGTTNKFYRLHKLTP